MIQLINPPPNRCAQQIGFLTSSRCSQVDNQEWGHRRREGELPSDLIPATGSPPSFSTVFQNPVISDELFIDEVRVPKGPPSEYCHTRDQVFSIGASGKPLRSKP